MMTSGPLEKDPNTMFGQATSKNYIVLAQMLFIGFQLLEATKNTEDLVVDVRQNVKAEHLSSEEVTRELSEGSVWE